jgi:hypothetical protein
MFALWQLKNNASPILTLLSFLYGHVTDRDFFATRLVFAHVRDGNFSIPQEWMGI